MDIFKDIKGFEREYQVDEKGNIYSLKYGKKRILKPYKDKDGYLHVILCKDGKRKQFLVHRLVAEAFIENTDNLPQVNHKNEDKTDNRACNLEWCDCKYNINYGTNIKRSSEKRKNNTKQSKSVAQYTLDGTLIGIYPSTNETGRQGFNQGNVAACCNGRHKQAYGYLWKWADC